MDQLKQAQQISKRIFEKVDELISSIERVTYLDLYRYIENYLKEIFNDFGMNFQQDLYGIEYGWAFPLGINVNEIVAHDSCNPEDIREIKLGDIIKIDIGVHVKGNIIDSARSYCIGDEDEKISSLIKSTRNATLNICKNIKKGSVINDLHQYAGDLSQENHSIQPVNYLCGHSVNLYKVHGGQKIPYVPSRENLGFIENGCYAIETFATTGPSKCISELKCNHFSLKENATKQRFALKATRDVYHWILNNRKTLPFSSLWVYNLFGSRGLFGLTELIKKKIVEEHSVLADVKGSFTSQHEHTILVENENVEILN